MHENPESMIRCRPRLSCPRRGVAALAAMLYLVLFSTLVCGFFAAFTLATQTAYNEREARRALAAAESGMEFIRFQLWSLDIQYDTPPDELFNTVYSQLSTALDGSKNLDGGSIALDGDTILIPGDKAQYVNINSAGDGFRLELLREGNQLVVRSYGRMSSGITAGSGRAVTLRYGIFERPSSIFDFGVASKSAIEMIGNTSILGNPDPASGSVLSTASTDFPLVMGNKCEISGEVSFSNPDAWVKAGSNAVINNEVGEMQWADNIHHVAEPDFPMVDTSDYLPYATTKIASAVPLGTQFVNILIPPNTNPTFAAGSEFYGVVYVQSPNNVKFAGKTTFRGILVTENNSTGNWATDNSIEFLGTVKAEGVSALPDSDPRFAGLKDMGGAFILAENFSVKFNGTAALGTNAITGSVVASNISFGGTADTVIEGSVINLEPDSSVYFSGNGEVTVKSSGTKSQPHGLYFGSRYVPLPGSYEEVLP